ncbi:MAG TPA: carboxypeptidase-like regulatory domain-containing protein, partial [Gemmatimonadales bacterium]|nr:carboxypeptidase-like regulatory domain-containing protein [Gemmatimonadales bacterium]
MRRIFGALVAIVLPVQAQTISGSILSTSGVPVPQALVVAWDAAGERARGEASPDGRFKLTLPDGAEPGVLNVRAIGYYPESVMLRGRSTTDLIIHLKSYVIPLPELTTRAARAVCPNSETPLARALWNAIRGRYVLTPVDSGWTAEMRRSSEQVGPGQVGQLDEERLSPGLQGVAGVYRSAAESFMRDSGYA